MFIFRRFPWKQLAKSCCRLKVQREPTWCSWRDLCRFPCTEAFA